MTTEKLQSIKALRELIKKSITRFNKKPDGKQPVIIARIRVPS